MCVNCVCVSRSQIKQLQSISTLNDNKCKRNAINERQLLFYIQHFTDANASCALNVDSANLLWEDLSEGYISKYFKGE